MKKINWNKIKDTYQIGFLVEGKVTHHFPFGIFVDIGSKSVIGLIQITDFTDEGIFSPKDYPIIGSYISAVVLAYTDGKHDSRNQIWLSMKPSILTNWS